MRSHIQDVSELVMRSLLLYECQGMGGAIAATSLAYCLIFILHLPPRLML
ncbi:hypothetical protein [Nostoc linckia]|nr:hypothetical protein [Nostoc linckia]